MSAARTPCVANTRARVRCKLPQHAEGLCWTHYAREAASAPQEADMPRETVIYRPAPPPQSRWAAWCAESPRRRARELAAAAAILAFVVPLAAWAGWGLAQAVARAIEVVT